MGSFAALLSGTDHPDTGAVHAPIGSVYVRTTGVSYQKQPDNSWSILGSGGGGSVDTLIVQSEGVTVANLEECLVIQNEGVAVALVEFHHLTIKNMNTLKYIVGIGAF